MKIKQITTEAANAAQQAAIAVNMKRAHKKPKAVSEGSISDLLNQDPTSPKFNDHPGPSKLKNTKTYTPTAGELARDLKNTPDDAFKTKYGMSKQQAAQHYSSSNLKEGRRDQDDKILRLFTSGKSPKAIAAQLSIDVDAVNDYINNRMPDSQDNSPRGYSSGRNVGQGMNEGHQSQWTVEQHTNGHHNAFYLVKGHNESREVWKNERGMSDFRNKSAAEAKAEELNSQQVNEAGGSFMAAGHYNNMIFQQNLNNLGQQLSRLSPEDLEHFNQIAMGIGLGSAAGVAGVIGGYVLGDKFMSLMRRTMSAAKNKAHADTEEIIKLQRQIVSIHKMLKRVKTEPTIAKYRAMLKQAYEVLEELEARHGNQVAEGKWNYPPEYTKKANADDEAELGISLINKDARKAWRKKQKAKAHTDLMTGKKKDQDVAEGRGFRGVGGAREREDDERHDLDPSDWYIFKDGKLLKASIYPREEAQAREEGFSPTREEARAKANKGVMEAGHYTGGGLDAEGFPKRSPFSCGTSAALGSDEPEDQKAAQDPEDHEEWQDGYEYGVKSRHNTAWFPKKAPPKRQRKEKPLDYEKLAAFFNQYAPDREITKALNQHVQNQKGKDGQDLDEGKSGIDKYVKLLKNHDWTYDYGDDQEAQRGHDERQVLLRLAKKLDPKFKIWNKYAPDDTHKKNLLKPKDNYDRNDPDNWYDESVAEAFIPPIPDAHNWSTEKDWIASKNRVIDYAREGYISKVDVEVDNKAQAQQFAKKINALARSEDENVYCTFKDNVLTVRSKTMDSAALDYFVDSAIEEYSIDEGKTGPGLWANIHAKQERIKGGSGERMRKPGSKGAPTNANFKAAAKTEGVAEGKKRTDRYHIVGKDGKPASLASYADQASAVKDRDAKHPGAEVRQVGPRGKVKGVSETTGDPKFDKMLKGITGKKAVTKQQKADTKQQSRDAFNGMFGGSSLDLTKNLKIREQGVAKGELTAYQKLLKQIRQNAKNDPNRIPRGYELTDHGQLVKKHKTEKSNDGVGGLGEEFNLAEELQKLDDAKYHGKTVPLNKPMAGDVAKSKVYVKDPSTGNVKKVNFGQKGVRIKKNNPGRRKSFRARHNCDNPGPKTKAKYWSCRAW